MRDHTLKQQPWLTKAEAAQYLRRSLRSIDSLLSAGELQAYRPGRKLLFAREDLDAFVRRYPANQNLDQLVDETLAELGGGK